MKKITVIGAALSGNKGAASMLIALVQNLKEIYLNNYILNCLTIYGTEDSRFNFYKNLRIVKCTPFDIICIIMPLSFLYFLMCWIAPIKKILLQHKTLRIIVESDLIVNIAGISYSDGRGFILLYNVACDLTPLLLKKKVFKYSQALGPFKQFPNRLCAKMILPKIERIAARGESTLKNLRSLDLHNYEHCPDGTFSMSVDTANIANEIKKTCNQIKDSRKINIGVAPSSVIEQYSSRLNVSYANLMSDFIEHSSKNGKYNLILFPYCSLINRKTKKNNDLEIVRNIYKKINSKQNITFLDKEYSAEDLKILISSCDVIITSRYHGMITALSTETVPLIIGWGHKYLETLDMFSLGNLYIDHPSLNMNLLKNKFIDIVNNLDDYKSKIASKLPEVKKTSLRNFTIIKELLESN